MVTGWALVTENNDRQLKTHSKVARVGTNFILNFFLENIWASKNRSEQVKVLSPLVGMATKKKS